MIGDESQVCTHCEELEWQCQCPPEPDEIINPTPDDYYDEPVGMSFEDSMCLTYPIIDQGDRDRFGLNE